MLRYARHRVLSFVCVHALCDPQTGVCVCVFALWGGCSVIGAVCVRSVPDALDANSNARNNLQTWNAVSQSENSRVAIHRSKTSIYFMVGIAKKMELQHNPVEGFRGPGGSGKPPKRSRRVGASQVLFSMNRSVHRSS